MFIAVKNNNEYLQVIEVEPGRTRFSWTKEKDEAKRFETIPLTNVALVRAGYNGFGNIKIVPIEE